MSLSELYKFYKISDKLSKIAPERSNFVNEINTEIVENETKGKIMSLLDNNYTSPQILLGLGSTFVLGLENPSLGMFGISVLLGLGFINIALSEYNKVLLKSHGGIATIKLNEINNNIDMSGFKSYKLLLEYCNNYEHGESTKKFLDYSEETLQNIRIQEKEISDSNKKILLSSFFNKSENKEYLKEIIKILIDEINSGKEIIIKTPPEIKELKSKMRI